MPRNCPPTHNVPPRSTIRLPIDSSGKAGVDSGFFAHALAAAGRRVVAAQSVARDRQPQASVGRLDQRAHVECAGLAVAGPYAHAELRPSLVQAVQAIGAADPQLPAVIVSEAARRLGRAYAVGAAPLEPMR